MFSTFFFDVMLFLFYEKHVQLRTARSLVRSLGHWHIRVGDLASFVAHTPTRTRFKTLLTTPLFVLFVSSRCALRLRHGVMLSAIVRFDFGPA